MATLKKGTVVTIGRMFGGRGKEIGKLLAQRMNIAYYDKELMQETAKKSGMSDDFIQSFDEKPTNSFMYSLATGEGLNVTGAGLTVSEQIHKTQVSVIKELAAKSPCVIVGRRADKILANDFDVVSIFVSACDEKRIEHVMERDGLSRQEAAKRLKKADRERRSYYNFYGDGNWGEADNYDLCVNSGNMTIEQAAELIEHFLTICGKTE